MKTEQPITYSIESIRERRLAKQKELKLSKDRMHNLSQQLFIPQQGQNKIDSLMQQINMGIAAYDGLMTGIKILRRVRDSLEERIKNIKSCLVTKMHDNAYPASQE